MTSILRFLPALAALWLIASAAAAQSTPESTSNESLSAGLSGPTADYDIGAPSDREVPPAQLRDVVSQAFDARQAAQRADVERVRRELAEIEAAIEQRERQREQIIDQRVQAILNQATASHPTNASAPVLPEPTKWNADWCHPPSAASW